MSFSEVGLRRHRVYDGFFNCQDPGSGLSNSLDQVSEDPDPETPSCTWSRQRVRQGGEKRAHSGASLATQNSTLHISTEIGATRRQCNVFFAFLLCRLP
jgi:hypothetical protein